MLFELRFYELRDTFADNQRRIDNSRGACATRQRKLAGVSLIGMNHLIIGAAQRSILIQSNLNTNSPHFASLKKITLLKQRAKL